MVWVPVVDPNPIPKLKIDLSTELRFKIFTLKQKFHPKKNVYIGFGFRIKFYTFWYRNQQKFKIFDSQKCLGLKISDFFENS